MTTENPVNTESTAVTDTDISGRRKVLKLGAAMALLPAILVTSGCGQKGPLYVPESESEDEEKKTSG